MNDPSAPRGVLLMTYGSPSSLDDVPRYLTAVRGGRAPDQELATEFRRRYEVIGGSPLIDRTRDQAAAVQDALGEGWVVRAAMRFSEPSIEAVLGEFAALGVRDAVGIILSPQYSPLLMGGYERAVEAARAALGAEAPRVTIAGAWYDEPALVAALGERIRAALARLDDDGSVPVLLTAHSLPRRVAEQEPDYLAQLEASARLVAEAAGLDASRWTFCWQSAGHEPGEWMTPDFADLMPRLRAAGHDRVLVAPIQFLADHLEILYDVEIGAREQAQEHDLRFERIASLNADPGLASALASVARRTAGDLVATSTGRPEPSATPGEAERRRLRGRDEEHEGDALDPIGAAGTLVRRDGVEGEDPVGQ
jgi:ferrochelatase